MAPKHLSNSACLRVYSQALKLEGAGTNTYTCLDSGARFGSLFTELPSPEKLHQPHQGCHEATVDGNQKSGGNAPPVEGQVVEIPLFTRGFIYPRWCRISAINSSNNLARLQKRGGCAPLGGWAPT